MNGKDSQRIGRNTTRLLDYFEGQESYLRLCQDEHLGIFVFLTKLVDSIEPGVSRFAPIDNMFSVNAAFWFDQVPLKKPLKRIDVSDGSENDENQRDKNGLTYLVR